MRHEYAVLGVRGLTALCAAAAVVGSWAAGGAAGTALGVAGGLPLVTALPGEALLGAVFPRRSGGAARHRATRRGRTRHDDDEPAGGTAGASWPLGWERLIWAVALSLACTALGGLLLNLLPGGLNRANWALLLTGITLEAAVIASARGDARYAPRRPRSTGPHRQLVLLVTAALIASGAVAVARTGAAQTPHPAFTQLWLVPRAGGTADLGVRSDESGPRRYRLVLNRPHASPRAWSFLLPPGQTWRRTVQVPTGRHLHAALYLAGTDRPYRHVDLPSR